MEARNRYPGSIGELVQGNFRGKDMLVSCPVNLYTEVRVYETREPINKYKNYKTAEFLKNILKIWDLSEWERNLDISIDSNIPKGKGFASSTADLCALYYALLKLFNRSYNEQQLIEQCIKIEPTDSIIFRDATLFEYKTGKEFQTIGPYMPFHILVFEGRRVIDTVEFNNRKLPMQENIEDLIKLLKIGVEERHIEKIGIAAAESIKRNQHRLQYEYLENIIDLCNKSGGSGVMGAHSGDCMGIIYEDKELLNYTHEKLCKEKNFLVNNFKIYGVNTVEIEL